MSLPSVIKVDEEKCVNCHLCISVCPVKMCNDGSGDTVLIDDRKCIGCGQCITACTHNARVGIDDTENMLEALRRGEKMVAVVAPAIACNFPDSYMRVNGWLKSIGIEAVFDVSFGAELTIKTYLDHMEKKKPQCVIAQPCPVIVSFIELYHPELLDYLAPGDSPMVHTMKMIKEFYPDYKDHSIAVISPCIAKKREFDAVGIGEYNVTMSKLQQYLDINNISLTNFPSVDYDTPAAERAVAFSTPGGLMRTAERWNGGISSYGRKIEGPQIIYKYLSSLHESIKKKAAPLLIDCLNCENGCNGGTGTLNTEEPADLLEHHIEKRNLRMQQKYLRKGFLGRKRTKRDLQKLIEKYWKDGLYIRKYKDLSSQAAIKTPSKSDIRAIFQSMHKYSQADIQNCAACGYNSCEMMAVAIHNGLNKAENCHHYISANNSSLMKEMAARQLEDNQIADIEQSTEKVNDNIQEILRNIKAINQAINDIAHTCVKSKEISVEATRDADNTVQVFNSLKKSAGEMGNVLKLIQDMVDNLKLLSLNASIEAASAGEAGKGFNVVAGEVKNLATRTGNAVMEIRESIESIQSNTDHADSEITGLQKIVQEIGDFQHSIASAVEEQSASMSELSNYMDNIAQSFDSITSHFSKLRLNDK